MYLRVAMSILLVIAASGCQSTGKFSKKFLPITHTESRVKLPEAWDEKDVERYASARAIEYFESITYRPVDSYTALFLSQLKPTHHWSARQSGSEFLKRVSKWRFLKNKKVSLGPRFQPIGGISRVQAWPMNIEKGHGHLTSCIGFMDHWGPGALASNFRNKVVGFICARKMEDAEAKFSTFMNEYDVQSRFYSGEGFVNGDGGETAHIGNQPRKPHDHFKDKLWELKLIGYGDAMGLSSCVVSTSLKRKIKLSHPLGATVNFKPSKNEDLQMAVKAVDANTLAGELLIVRRGASDIRHEFQMHSTEPNPRLFEYEIDMDPPNDKPCHAMLTIKRIR